MPYSLVAHRLGSREEAVALTQREGRSAVSAEALAASLPAATATKASPLRRAGAAVGRTASVAATWALKHAAWSAGRRVAKRAVERGLLIAVSGIAGRSFAHSLTRKGLLVAGHRGAKAVVRSEVIGAAAELIVDQGIARVRIATGGLDRLDYALRTGESIGSAVGSLAGIRVGAAIGSAIFPVVGTSAGAAMGGILGGLGGSAAGRAVARRLAEREERAAAESGSAIDLASHRVAHPAWDTLVSLSETAELMGA